MIVPSSPGPSSPGPPSPGPPSPTPSSPPAGLVLAAGGGRRMGGVPKALLRGADGTAWVRRAIAALADGGCDPVLVTVGAQAEAVAALVPAPARVVRVPDWAEGLSRSLRAGLLAAAVLAPRAPALVVVPVDTPGLTAAAVARLAALAGPDVLARAVYDGAPGHPVLIGRSHWQMVAARPDGDRGAAGYLARHGAVTVDCADVADGRDVDGPALPPTLER